MIDLPGHSPAAFQSSLAQPEQLIDDLCARTPQNSVWVGWSLGGMLAQRLACRHPGHVRQLVCIAAGLQFLSSDDWPCGLSAQDFSSFVDLFIHREVSALKYFSRWLDVGEDPRHQQTLQTILASSKDKNELLSLIHI